MTGVLMSIKPVFAEAILSGRKTVELRRRAPRTKPGDLVLIYETSPTMAVVGVALVEGVETRKPTRLWKRVQSSSLISQKQFAKYFADCEVGTGIHLAHPVRFERPVHLHQLRQSTPGFLPPQSWRYLDGLPPRMLKFLHAAIADAMQTS